jgi:hypothetical protein
MNPEFNDELAIASSSLIWIQRRNCLQRYVSAIISRRLRYWIGPKEEYLQRLDARGFPPLCPDDARESIRLDVEAVRNREGLLIARGVRFITVYYEDIFDDSVTGNEQLKQVNRVLTFLGRNSAPVSITQSEAWLGVMNQDRCKWNSQSVYKRIPGISQFERLTGSDETGWLFNKG